MATIPRPMPLATRTSEAPGKQPQTKSSSPTHSHAPRKGQRGHISTVGVLNPSGLRAPTVRTSTFHTDNYPALEEVHWGVEAQNDKTVWFGEYWVQNMPQDNPARPFTEHDPIQVERTFTVEEGTKWSRVPRASPLKGCSCGYGKAYDDNKVCRAEGIWDKGAFVFGIAYNADGTRIYEGNYLNAKRHGRGVEYSALDGEKVFEGTFFNGARLHGTEFNQFSPRKA